MASTPTAPRTQSNGMLPVTASQTTGSASKTSSAKPPSPKLKVIVRRLAPGLTEAEFTSILGEEWKLGKGKVDWFLYKPGKDSKDPSKPSRPSRAYLHLTSNDHLITLSDSVRQLTFEDAQNTFMSPSLIGPPSVEFAPYGRVPGGRRRTDARAGTIDQDPEFMAFLEGLANPTSAPEILESSVPKPEKVTMTPLVQYLKDKKANKSKEAAVKLAKKQDAKGKGKEVAKESPEDTKNKGKEAKVDKLVEKAAKEAVKILNRQTTPKKKTGFDAVRAAEEAPIVITPGGKAVRNFDHVPHRQRGAVIAAANRMFKRDISLAQAQAQASAQGTSVSGKENSAQPPDKAAVPTALKGAAAQSGRKGRGKGSSEESKESATTNASASSTPGPSSPMVLLKKPATSQPETAPAIQSPKAAPIAPKPAPTPVARKPPPVEVPSEGATRAFVKHANPSQGVTEPLLKEAMEKFGAVLMVEIDRRKGFAYVDFVESDGLKKAMAANPTSVAQGTVQVMERKPERAARVPGPTTGTGPKKPPFQGPPRGGRGGGGGGGSVGRRGGRGGGRVASQGGGSESPKPPAASPSGPAAK